MIKFTRPTFPSQTALLSVFDQLGQNRFLTNYAEIVSSLESNISNYLKKDVALLNSGTTALHVAIKALNLSGEIITTPFSYFSSVSSIIWENCTPVFVDIDPQTLQLDSSRIEEKINANTTAILGVHLFGGACNIEEIEKIAQTHKLKTIYDAAHGFGTTYNGKALNHFGDAITYSFNATKWFHAVEGGAVSFKKDIVTHQVKEWGNMKRPINQMMTNAKMSELHGAIGKWNFENLDSLAKKRKKQWHFYYQMLSGELPFRFPKINSTINPNYAYFALIVEEKELLTKIQDALEKANIISKQYFHPLLSHHFNIKASVPHAESISRRCICLPLYHALKQEEQEKVCKTIVDAI